MINIIIADDSHLIRKNLITLLASEPDFKVIGEARNGFEAVEKVTALHPDVLILDLMMPGLNGLNVLAELKQSNLKIASVILSIHTDLAYVRETLRLRAKAYVSKDAPTEDLIHAVREAAAGRTYMCSCLNPIVGNKPSLTAALDG